MPAPIAAPHPPEGDPAPAVAVAGLSVRAMAESLARAGVPVVALDVFGDADTRAASLDWRPIATDAGLAIDPARFTAALEAAAACRPLRGWIAGSGFEAHPELLDAPALQGVPRLGTAAPGLRAVREPRVFFAVLDALGLPHPAVRFTPPPSAEPGEWLLKDSARSGGWGVRPWLPGAVAASPTRYWQRRVPGTPVSALFLADGREARVVGLSEQLTAGEDLSAVSGPAVSGPAVSGPFGRGAPRPPYVYAGAIAGWPAPLRAAGLAQALAQACQALTAHAGLRGLCSLDAIAGPGGLHLLELNPRPSASQALHDHAVEGGLMRAHLALCSGGPWPALQEDALQAPGRSALRIVYAPQSARFGEGALQAAARAPWCHDRPATAQSLAAGQPVCSVSAGLDAACARGDLAALLAQRRAEVLQWLEPVAPAGAACAAVAPSPAPLSAVPDRI